VLRPDPVAEQKRPVRRNIRQRSKAPRLHLWVEKRLQGDEGLEFGAAEVEFVKMHTLDISLEYPQKHTSATDHPDAGPRLDCKPKSDIPTAGKTHVMPVAWGEFLT
jgi:hypothetical protein